jgi:hypothetical protein
MTLSPSDRKARASDNGLGLLDDIEIFDTKSSHWRNDLYNLLEYKPSAGEAVPTVLDQVLERGVDTLGARWIVAEPYISTDWADEYQAWYSRIFRHVSRLTTRLHFFSRQGPRGFPRQADRIKLQVANLHQLLDTGSAHYLGYSVIRPFQTGDPERKYVRAPTVGETVLEFPAQADVPGELHMISPVHGTPTSFPTSPARSFCVTPFRTHLRGFELQVSGFPFIQQDQVVSVCAEANLWMVARYLHAKGEGRRFRPSEMERSAASVYSIGPARVGLDDYQLYGALRQLGINADRITPGNASDALSLLTAFTSSGMPVIASVGPTKPDDPLEALVPNHVIAILGATFGEEKPDWAIAKGKIALPESIQSAAWFMDSTIVHDDSIGPYIQLPPGFQVEVIQPPDAMAGGASEGGESDQSGKPVSYERLTLGPYTVFQFFIPLPARVHFRMEDVRAHLVYWLGPQGLRSPKAFGKWSECWSADDLKNLLVRCYLLPGARLKREALRVAGWMQVEHGISADEWGLVHYWRQPFPRYVWVVELSTTSPYSLHKMADHRIVGEFVFDATAHFSDFENALLSARLKGRMVYRDYRVAGPRRRLQATWQVRTGDNRGWKLVPGLSTTPYRPFVT